MVMQDFKNNVGYLCFVYTLCYLLTCFTKPENVFFFFGIYLEISEKNQHVLAIRRIPKISTQACASPLALLCQLV